MNKEKIIMVLVLAGTLIVGYYGWKAERWLNWRWSYNGQVENATRKSAERVEEKFDERINALEKRVVTLEKASIPLEKK